MSFFNTFRGFGRSSKKNKPAANQPSSTIPSALGGEHHPSGLQQKPSSSRLNGSGNAASAAALIQAGAQKPLFLCQPFVRTALVKGTFQTIVMLPKYVDAKEWIALNIFEFFTYLNQFYGVISDFETCPSMNAGPGVDYTWVDNNGQEVRLPASTFIDYVLTWISSKFDDQTLFPTKQGVPFPAHFFTVVKKMYQQMFRIFAHLYHNHFDKIVHLSLEAHWNSFFAHFITFGKQFELADRSEMKPMEPLILAMEAQGKIG